MTWRETNNNDSTYDVANIHGSSTFLECMQAEHPYPWKYLAVLMPRVHRVPPLAYLFLNRRQLALKELPHDVYVAAIQPVMINRDGVLL